MQEKGAGDPRRVTYEPDSTVRVRPPALDERMMAVASAIAPEMMSLLAAYEARVATCDHLAFDELTCRIAYRCGDEGLFSGVVEELARLSPDGVLVFAWREHVDAPPPTPRVETARAMLAGLGLHALLFGELAIRGVKAADVDAILLLALHLYEADGLFREERGGAKIYYAVYEGEAPSRPGRSGKLRATLSSFRLPKTTTRPIPREEGSVPVRRVESVTPAAGPSPTLLPSMHDEPAPVSGRTPRPPPLPAILPVAQILFTDLAAVLDRVRSAILLVNVLRTLPRVTRVDVMATDGDGELHAFDASPHLHQAVENMIENETETGGSEWRRLVVHVSATAQIRVQAR
jgi:hypothetical protein